MFVVLHVLLNSSALLNLVQSYHLCSREYTDMQPFAMHYFQNCKQNFGGKLSTIATLMFVVLHVMLNNSALLNPDHKYPSPLTWIHRCATLCNAQFSRRQSILELIHYNFGGELSTIATLMFAMLYVLLNSFTLLNPIQSYYLHICQYTDMHPFAMHRF